MEITVEELLDILGNRTRRKILEFLALEPLYLPQLARELNVTQQAILKHLNILENIGLIDSFEMKSEKGGPPRKYYRLSGSYFLSLDIGSCITRFNATPITETKFPSGLKMSVNLHELNEQVRKAEEEVEADEKLKKSIKAIREINKALANLDRMRASLINLKATALKEAYSSIKSISKAGMGRKTLYQLLNLFENPSCEIMKIMDSFNPIHKSLRSKLLELWNELKEL